VDVYYPPPELLQAALEKGPLAQRAPEPEIDLEQLLGPEPEQEAGNAPGPEPAPEAEQEAPAPENGQQQPQADAEAGQGAEQDKAPTVDPEQAGDQLSEEDRRSLEAAENTSPEADPGPGEGPAPEASQPELPTPQPEQKPAVEVG